MMKKIISMVLVLVIMIMCTGCGSNDEKADVSSRQFIVVVNEAMSMEEISQNIAASLPSNQQVTVEDVEMSEENKYLVTIRSQLTEDEVVSLLKEQDWIQKVEINYELKMY